ncbi:MAG: type III pantothenate kinase [Nitrospirae bacterium]|jgi:type III pantothenate kinase|nr:type III pantothenate kinase [Nitrospirota bacterium]
MVTVKMGVSRISFALHDHGGKIRSILVRSTPREKLSPEGWESLLSLPPLFRETDCFVAIVSVVPSYTESLKIALAGSKKGRIIPLERTAWGLDILYRPPDSLGEDRLAACAGARSRFPDLEGGSYVVADFGTHTVLTVVDGGTVLGGSIAPGIVSQLQSIGQGLVLGAVPLQFPEKPLGENTRESVASGVLLGTVRGVEGLVREMEQVLGKPLKLVLTGGLSRYVRPLFKVDCRFDRHLIHRGTWQAACRVLKKKSG